MIRSAVRSLVGILFLVLAGFAVTVSAAEAVPLFDGLGSFGRRITTKSPESQRYFNQGLSFLYAFNHDEAIRSFQRATELDPECAMAWWGISIANGPHINNPLVAPEKSQAAWNAHVKAREFAARATQVERGLIEALGERYAQTAPADRKPLDEAYAAAMRRVWQRFPTDADVGALFAESLMDLRPWDLWQPEGTPQPGTDEIVSTLSAVLSLNPNHPLALHLHIHAVEASPHPEQAEETANRLRDLQPGLGHLVHMPSHIDVRRGNWARAIEANRKAIVADKAYRQKTPQQDFYRVYMAHNHHMLAFAAMMRGQSHLTLAALNEMVQEIPSEWLQANALFADGFTAMPLEGLVRFGRWSEILAAPEPPKYLPVARTLRHYARGIAFAAQGKVAEAEAEHALFLQAKTEVLPEAQFGNNRATDLLGVAEQLLKGEILYRSGKVEPAIEALREAIAREDRLRYSEPPDWIHPVRHVLGATLLKENRAEEAERVFREDLGKLPENVWSLFGLAQSLRKQGRDREAAEWESRFQKARSDADIVIDTSCLCQRIAPEPLTINVWPGKPPGETKELGPEADLTKPEDRLIAGRRIIKLGNVSTPQLTVYRPLAEKDMGAAVIICPGGGHNILAYDLEGTEVASWLNEIGVTGIVLKYRVPFRDPEKRWLAAVQDAQRAMSLVRSRAAEWKLDPQRIGVLGFSAGGQVAALVSILDKQRQYEPLDDVDQVSSRPDFAVLVYPGGLDERGQARLRPEVQVSKESPPMFFVHAYDDNVSVFNTLLLAGELKKVGVSAEVHVYATGGHGYGLRHVDGEPVTDWPKNCEAWMKSLGFIH